ncbi:MAG: phosphoribosylamine--glycine ligase [Chloroflexi bacterium]|nr:phosphoribosylamine--glycine ligase [Chloroflexota bacterium]
MTGRRSTAERGTYRVLILGSGAREHALAWKLRQSPLVDRIFALPGNGGTATCGENWRGSIDDVAAILELARDRGVNFAVVGPEDPLAGGVVDELEAAGIPTFGPSREAAKLEASKAFAKELMLREGVPCARGEAFDDLGAAQAYIENHDPPVVVKADGLAGGKGVTVAQTRGEAIRALDRIMTERAFGQAGDRVVIEECLVGREASYMAFVDGDTFRPMAPAMDYKRLKDGDQGPNTGGMGAYSPPAFFTRQVGRTVDDRVLRPVVRAMARLGTPFKGVLYAGLMLTAEGPKVLEFNVRFGDPETQVVLPRLRTDLMEVMMATVEGRLGQARIDWSDEACVGVVVASEGYPGPCQTGFAVQGLAGLPDEVIVFHAGTRLEPSISYPPTVLTSGGRVLTVVALGRSPKQARAKVYRNIQRITFRCRYFRRDIARRDEPTLPRPPEPVEDPVAAPVST